MVGPLSISSCCIQGLGKEDVRRPGKTLPHKDCVRWPRGCEFAWSSTRRSHGVIFPRRNTQVPLFASAAPRGPWNRPLREPRLQHRGAPSFDVPYSAIRGTENNSFQSEEPARTGVMVMMMMMGTELTPPAACRSPVRRAPSI